MSGFERAFSKKGPNSTAGRWGMRIGAAALAFALPSTMMGLFGHKVDLRPAEGTNRAVAAVEWVPEGLIDGGNIAGREVDRLIGDAVDPVIEGIDRLAIGYLLGPQQRFDDNNLFANQTPQGPQVPWSGTQESPLP